jgi:hypothetical protein
MRMFFVCILFAGQAQAAAVFDFITDSVAQDPRFTRPLDAASEAYVRGMLDRLGVTLTDDVAELKFHTDLELPRNLVVTANHGFSQASFLNGGYNNGVFSIGALSEFKGDVALARADSTLSGHFDFSNGSDQIFMSGSLWSGVFNSDFTLGHHPITGHWVLIAEVGEPPVLALMLLALLFAGLCLRASRYRDS